MLIIPGAASARVTGMSGRPRADPVAWPGARAAGRVAETSPTVQ